MFNSTNLPQHKVVYYANDAQTGYYTKTPQQPDIMPVMRLPCQLKVEPTQLHQIKCNAGKIIRGKETFKNGAFKFFTGLQHTDYKDWFAGNDYENFNRHKQLSLCLFYFSTDNSHLTVVYFGRFYIDNPTERRRFTNDIIPVFKERLLL